MVVSRVVAITWHGSSVAHHVGHVADLRGALEQRRVGQRLEAVLGEAARTLAAAGMGEVFSSRRH
jgi:hypothetical protein